jgi:hypothetical protein
MGIRKSLGKNRKSKARTEAIAVTRDAVRRQAAGDAGRGRPRGTR